MGTTEGCGPESTSVFAQVFFCVKNYKVKVNVFSMARTNQHGRKHS
jgi:hypothetical protein